VERQAQPQGQSAQTAREQRPGCLAARALGLLARLVLVAPPVVMGAQVGLWLHWRMGWARDAAFALAGLGMFAGLALGVALLLRAVRPDGGRRLRADVMLALMAAVFLARAALAWVQPPAMEDVGVAYLATLAGALLVWLLG